MALAARLGVAAREAGRARAAWLARCPGGPDPAQGNPHVREGAGQGGGAAARALARWLERAAVHEPASAALTLLAFLAEEVERPAPPLASTRALQERWELLRASLPGAPALERSLAAAPPHLELGLRLAGGELRFGLQLTAAGLASGVRRALRKAPVRRLARAVLASLGPRAACPRCGDVLAVHVARLSGVDEVHGLACPRCGEVLRSYLRFGPPEGLEGLAGVAARVGLTAVARLRLGQTLLAFGMLPSERAALTASALLERLDRLCLAPLQLDLPPGALALRAGRRLLLPHEPVPRRGALSVAATRLAGRPIGSLAAQLRGRIARRFRG